LHLPRRTVPRVGGLTACPPAPEPPLHHARSALGNLAATRRQRQCPRALSSPSRNYRPEGTAAPPPVWPNQASGATEQPISCAAGSLPRNGIRPPLRYRREHLRAGSRRGETVGS